MRFRNVSVASSCTFGNAMQHFAPYICHVQLTLRGEVEPGEPPSTLPTVSDDPRSLFVVHLLFPHHRAPIIVMPKIFFLKSYLTINRWEPTS